LDVQVELDREIKEISHQNQPRGRGGVSPQRIKEISYRGVVPIPII
jgi:hypothetical protein